MIKNDMRIIYITWETYPFTGELAAEIVFNGIYFKGVNFIKLKCFQNKIQLEKNKKYNTVYRQTWTTVVSEKMEKQDILDN